MRPFFFEFMSTVPSKGRSGAAPGSAVLCGPCHIALGQRLEGPQEFGKENTWKNCSIEPINWCTSSPDEI